MKINAMRRGGSASCWPADVDSSHGSDIAAPTPRSHIRREIGLDIDTPPVLLPAYHRNSGTDGAFPNFQATAGRSSSHSEHPDVSNPFKIWVLTSVLTIHVYLLQSCLKSAPGFY